MINPVNNSQDQSVIMDDIINSLIGIIWESNELEDAILKNLENDTVTNLDFIKHELKILKACTISSAIEQFPMENESKRLVIEKYHNQLDKISNQTGTNVFAQYSKRLPDYSSVMDSVAKDGPAEDIGTSFAKFCGNETNPKLVLLGSSLFVAIFGGVLKMMASCRTQREIFAKVPN